MICICRKIGKCDLQALYDRSDGFYRRQLVLTTKEKPADRADDPDLAEKMKAEAEGIFLWAFEGLNLLTRLFVFHTMYLYRILIQGCA